MADNIQKKNPEKSRLEHFSVRLGLIGGIIGILSFIPQVREFFGWTKSLKYVELKASFPNEKWLEADKKDYAWLVGEWDVPKLRGFTAVFKIENGKLYRQNKGVDHSYQADNFISEWYSIEVHKSTNDILRLAYDKESKWPINFIRKDDNCVCYETERYMADDGSIRSTEGRQMLNIEHTKLSSDGMIYNCH